MTAEELIAIILSNVYLQSITIFIIFFVISKLIFYIFQKYIIKITAKTKTEVDDLIVKKISRPVSFLLLVIGVRVALVPLPLSANGINLANNIISTIIALIIGFVVVSLLKILLHNWGKLIAEKTKSKMDDNILSLLQKISNVVVFILLALIFLDIWGIKIGPLLASLGIAGLAIAFALQTTLSNVFGGISLILDKTIKIGDIIKLDSGEMGIVHDIGIRSTKIKTWNNELLTVPNGKLVESRIQNYSMPDPSARIDIKFGVEYGSDIEKVKKVVLDTIEKIKEVIEEPAPKIWFMEMGDFALKFKVMFWVANLSEKWPTHQEAITGIYNNLNKSKIGIPFPCRTVYLKK